METWHWTYSKGELTNQFLALKYPFGSGFRQGSGQGLQQSMVILGTFFAIFGIYLCSRGGSKL